nr:MAG TPA: hypothetical protein [Caudoviricetes sp.]
MILKRDNVERIVLDDSVAKSMLSQGWTEISSKEEKPKKQKKKEDD